MPFFIHPTQDLLLSTINYKKNAQMFDLINAQMFDLKNAKAFLLEKCANVWLKKMSKCLTWKMRNCLTWKMRNCLTYCCLLSSASNSDLNRCLAELAEKLRPYMRGSGQTITFSWNCFSSDSLIKISIFYFIMNYL